MTAHKRWTNATTSHIFFTMIFLKMVLFGVSSASAQKEKKPNVLFIISDDLTTTALSNYENTLSRTPNIDKLTSEGMLYTRAYSQFPVSGPSRASLMFGYYPHATETFGYVSGRENVGQERESWSQLFKNNGYYTARVSKIFHMGIPTAKALTTDLSESDS